jgi:dTDP-4-dehydrorhamnose reductase
LKILLIGASGQLGTDLVEALSRHQLVTPPRQSLDVVEPDRIHRVLQTERPQVVINTAAFHRVDQCESEVLTSFRVNGEAVRNLALAARDVDAVLVHYSTDYVFDGAAGRPYLEEDRPRPLNVYGVSKLAGEQLLESVWEKRFLIRTCGLYGRAGSRGKGGNFVETMIRKAGRGESIRVVDDQRLTPTSTRELARKTAGLIETCHYGLYHVTSNGDCTWYEFAREIFTALGVQADLSPTTSDRFRAAARRPAYSVLANHRLSELGMDDLKDWREALRDYLRPRMN